ncbi:MAG: putative bifunctional diguanylate cyclase/phosphodiesterase [Desulfonatronovibrionaceae bacterium]
METEKSPPLEDEKQNPDQYSLSYLKERIDYLDRLNRNTLEAMENVVRLGDFQESFGKLSSVNLILDKIVDGCSNTIPVDACYIYLIDKDNEFVLYLEQGQTDIINQDQELNNLIETRKLAQAILHKKPLRHLSTNGQELLVHILATSSRVRGLFLAVLKDSFQSIPDYALSVLKILMLSGANCIENYELYQTLRDKISKLEDSEKQLSIQAFHDSLTRLPNRFFLMQKLKDAIKRNSRNSRPNFALLMLDLDNFKRINDSMGHHIGDELLKKVAGRLSSLLREYDTVGRLGGDEFILLLENIDSRAQVIKVVKRIHKEMQQPFILDNQEIYISTSTGVVLNCKWNENEEDLLRNADVAMYKAKKSKKGHYKVFTQKMYNQAVENMELEIEIGRALDNAEFELFYQPILSCDATRIYGAEALLRWKYATAAHIPPTKFIPIAEETGLIVPLGKWVLQRALSQIKPFVQKNPDFLLSVNISPRQFKHKSIMRHLEDFLRAGDFPPENLLLEITESTLFDDYTKNAAKLEKIRKTGIKFALDDFGTGYSSLNHLKNIPVDFIKVDKSFISESKNSHNNRAILEGIVNMAHAINIQVIAEGIEEREQLRMVYRAGCDALQGFLFSRPLNLCDLKKFLGASTQFSKNAIPAGPGIQDNPR